MLIASEHLDKPLDVKDILKLRSTQFVLQVCVSASYAGGEFLTRRLSKIVFLSLTLRVGGASS